MSPIRYRGRHRKPRRPRTNSLLRGGVLTGVVGTVAVTGATAPASAAEQPAESTAELPVLRGALSDSTTVAAEATRLWAGETALREARTAAQERAVEEAEDAAARLRAERAEEEEEARRAAAQAAQEAADARAEEEAAGSTAGEDSGSSAGEAAAQDATTLSAPAPSGDASAVVAFVQSHVGDGYAMGGTGPSTWDCSGLVQAAYASVGVSLPRVSGAQSTAGTQVSLDALQPGDILYWGGAGSAYHVAIYVGGGSFIGAQNASTGVVQHDMSYDPPTGAVRVL
ncbi:C40 family peptidase [Streptomyces sp. RFCAC02]|uniref:C40 family peptidase n=1 Tax=Streptomyces sp. RFCAC02 TaxID=2499143 RepID=UPI00101F0062|nr:C40 family peptidase [Streptomyces sp. RFCAC02]